MCLNLEINVIGGSLCMVQVFQLINQNLAERIFRCLDLHNKQSNYDIYPCKSIVHWRKLLSRTDLHSNYNYLIQAFVKASVVSLFFSNSISWAKLAYPVEKHLFCKRYGANPLQRPTPKSKHKSTAFSPMMSISPNLVYLIKGERMNKNFWVKLQKCLVFFYRKPTKLHCAQNCQGALA